MTEDRQSQDRDRCRAGDDPSPLADGVNRGPEVHVLGAGLSRPTEPIDVSMHPHELSAPDHSVDVTTRQPDGVEVRSLENPSVR